ncbi:hypothetical protein BKA64DRAFT_220711 [Cadophora sp. MPI-SDFR-AT-0126]|nr:hypothetical protein BKA64DRAFT_220711 [Leotiomycetes sp. MPI-SDFR-AT-0126]
MRTSTLALRGLGFLSFLAPASADDNVSTLGRRQAPPAGTFVVGTPTTVYANPNSGVPGTIADLAYTQQQITFTALTNSAILTISAQNDGLFSYDDFSVVKLDDTVNIVGNPGFETGSLLPWYSVSGPGNAIPDAGAGNVFTGTYGLVVDATAGSTEVVAQVLSTTANTVYTVSFWVRSVGSTNAVTTVTIQSQIEPPTIIGLTPETDNGPSSTDGQTTISNPVLVGTGDFATQIEISVNGAVIGFATPLADGTFTYQLPNLAAGTSSVTVTGISSFDGTRTPTTAPYTIVFSPVIPTIALDPASDSGNPGDGITSQTSITLTGTATGGSSINLLDSGVVVTSGGANLDGTWSITIFPTIGTHSYRIINVPDTYGLGPSLPLALNIVAVPDPPVLTGLDPASDDGTPGDLATSILTPIILGTALVGSNVVLFDGNNAQIGSGIADGVGNFAITTSPLALGSQSIYGQQTDTNGEISGTGTSIFFFIVPETPVITALVPSLGTNVNGDPTTSSLQPTLEGTSSPAVVVEIYENGAYVGAGDTNPNGAFSATFFSPLALGLHTFIARASSTAGFVSENTQPFTIEVVEPSASSSEVLSSTVSSESPSSTSIESSITLSEATQSSVSESSTASSDIITSTSAETFSTGSFSESSTLSASTPLTTSAESFSSLFSSETSESASTSTDVSTPPATAVSTGDLFSSSILPSDSASSVATGSANSQTSVPTVTSSIVDNTETLSSSSVPAPTASIPTETTEVDTSSTQGFSTMSWSNSSIPLPSATSEELETSVPTVVPTFQPTTEVPSPQSSFEVSASLTASSPTLSGSVSSPVESSVSSSGSVISSSLAETSPLQSGTDIPTAFTAPSATLSSSESATSETVTPSLPPSAPFFLVVQAAPGLKKRQVTSGSSYLSLVNGQLVATRSCTELPPVSFTIDNDRLAIDDTFATTTTALVLDPGFSPIQFQSAQGPADIQTVFSIDPTLGSLSWTDATFLNSNAQFCLLNNVLVAAYTVSVSSIAGCVPVVVIRSFDVCSNATTSSTSTLPGTSTANPSATSTSGSGPVTTGVSIIVGVEITIQITIININIVINGVLVPTTKTETQTITSPLIATPAPSVGTSVINGKTEYFTTTVACGICQCQGAVPGEITAYRTVTVCPTCKPTPVNPVVETIVPCGKCQPLIPGPSGPSDQTKGGALHGNPYTEYVPAGPGIQPAPPAPVNPGGKSPDVSKPEGAGTVPVVGAPPAGTSPNPSTPSQSDVTGTTVKGQPEKPVEYTGGAATFGPTSAIFGILVSILLLI